LIWFRSIRRRCIGQTGLQLLERLEEALVHLLLLASHSIPCNHQLEIPILPDAAKADEQIGVVHVLIGNSEQFHAKLVLPIGVGLSQGGCVGHKIFPYDRPFPRYWRAAAMEQQRDLPTNVVQQAPKAVINLLKHCRRQGLRCSDGRGGAGRGYCA